MMLSTGTASLPGPATCDAEMACSAPASSSTTREDTLKGSPCGARAPPGAITTFETFAFFCLPSSPVKITSCPGANCEADEYCFVNLREGRGFLPLVCAPTSEWVHWASSSKMSTGNGKSRGVAGKDSSSTSSGVTSVSTWTTKSSAELSSADAAKREEFNGPSCSSSAVKDPPPCVASSRSDPTTIGTRSTDLPDASSCTSPPIPGIPTAAWSSAKLSQFGSRSVGGPLSVRSVSKAPSVLACDSIRPTAMGPFAVARALIAPMRRKGDRCFWGRHLPRPSSLATWESPSPAQHPKDVW
mmetsp:Transcript_86213/g.230902  ORF Transcript_86213/g.230902 Transcript_86213/m.230902 type:complete len:300 (-) Transcript_86213:48-947(-)